MKSDITKVKDLPSVFIPADKGRNMNKLSTTEYKKIFESNITKTYKKATPHLEDAINLRGRTDFERYCES